MTYVQVPISRFSLFDPTLRDRRFELYEALREDSPVVLSADGFWCVSRYEHVQEVLLAPDRFSNAPNQAEALGMGTNLDPSVDPELFERASAIVAKIPFDIGELMNSRFLPSADPPKHTVLRKVVNRGFTARQMTNWTDRVHELVDGGLASVRAGEPWDLMTGMALDLPVHVICDMLGVESTVREDFKRWGQLIITASQGSTRMTPDATLRLLGMLAEFSQYFLPLIERRRIAPGDDIISQLVQAEHDDYMTPVETILFIILLMVGGIDTTTSLIGNTVVSLMRNPAELAKLAGDPSLVPRAIEETLRYMGPVHFVTRRSIGDQEIGGVIIPDGALVAPLVASGNRDPREFDRPDEFDITRSDNHHLTFGHGIHFCLGAHFGRLETQIAVESLLPHMQERSLGADDLPLIDSNTIWGYERVELLPRGLSQEAR
jgi:cytochrome P450